MSKLSTRDQIFDAALKLLCEKGFNACSVNDITVEAGVPKGSFYNHFDSKEALGSEIVAFYGGCNNVRDVLSDSSIAPMERLRLYFARLNDMVISNNFEQGCLIGNFSAELSDQSPMIRDQLAIVYAGWTRMIEASIAEGQAERSINRDIEPRVLASFLLNAWEGATLRARAERSRQPFDDFMTVMFQKILN